MSRRLASGASVIFSTRPFLEIGMSERRVSAIGLSFLKMNLGIRKTGNKERLAGFSWFPEFQIPLLEIGAGIRPFLIAPSVVPDFLDKNPLGKFRADRDA